MPEFFTPAEQAAIDQHRAKLRDHIAMVREHWTAGDCHWGGAAEAACVSSTVGDEIEDMTRHEALLMYTEALIMLAGTGDGDDGAAPGN